MRLFKLATKISIFLLICSTCFAQPRRGTTPHPSITGIGDGRYLKLDASNDPITGDLELSSDLTVSGSSFFTEPLYLTATDIYTQGPIDPATAEEWLHFRPLNADGLNLAVHGDGTGNDAGYFLCFDEDDSHFTLFGNYANHGYITSYNAATLAEEGNMRFSESGGGDVTFFDGSAEGITKEFKTYGYRTGDSKRSLEVGVGVDAADTASFDGVSAYYFDGSVNMAQDLTVAGTTHFNGVDYNWPSADGSNLQVLHTDGAGHLSWDTDDSGGAGGNTVYIEEGDVSRVDSSGADLYVDFDDADFDVGTVGNEANITINDSGIDHDATTNYVADQHIDWTGASDAFSTSGTLAGGAATITGTANISSDLTVAGTAFVSPLGILKINTDTASDPKIKLETTNTTHCVEIFLDEDVAHDHLFVDGTCSGQDTGLVVRAPDGQNAELKLFGGLTNHSQIIHGTADNLSIRTLTDDADIKFVVDDSDGDSTTTITIDASEAGKITHETGTFNFDDDNLTTTGTLASGNATITGTASISSDVTLSGTGTSLFIPDSARIYDATAEIATTVPHNNLKHYTATFDPSALYDQDSSNHNVGLFTVGDDFPEGMIIDEWQCTYTTGDPTTELDANLYFADDWAWTGETLIDAIDTSNGSSSEDTDSNIYSGGTILNGKKVYIGFDADPTDSNVLITFEIWFHAK